jgi:hypothetical protein
MVFETSGWTFNVAAVVDSEGQLTAIWQYNPYKKTGEGATLSDNKNESLFIGLFDGEGWSTPSEVLLGPFAASRLATATDHVGKLHIFSQNTCLWHTAANLDQVDMPQAWSDPECLADGASAWPATTVSPDGRINLLFSEPSAKDILFVSSGDDGESWTQSVLVVQYDNPSIGVANLALAETSGGILHAVWAEVSLPAGYPPMAVMYSRSLDRGNSWSAPVELAGERQGEPAVVADMRGRVHVAWNGDVSDGGRYYVHSLDDGLSWEPVEVILRGSGGLQYPPALAVDSTGLVHGLFTNDTAVVYSVRGEWGWTPIEELLGPETVSDPGQLAEIDSARLLITPDSVLHALYTRFRFGEVVHQWRAIGAPAETRATVAPLPSPPPTMSSDATRPAETPTNTRVPLPATPHEPVQAEPLGIGMPPLAFAIVPVLAMLVLVIAVSTRRRW